MELSREVAALSSEQVQGIWVMVAKGRLPMLPCAATFALSCLLASAAEWEALEPSARRLIELYKAQLLPRGA